MNTNNSEQVIWFIELSKYSKERLFDPLLNGRFLPFTLINLKQFKFIKTLTGYTRYISIKNF